MTKSVVGFSHEKNVLHVECSEDLHKAIFSSPVTMRGRTDSERRLGVVAAYNCDPAVAPTSRPTVVELRTELLDADEVLIGVLGLR